MHQGGNILPEGGNFLPKPFRDLLRRLVVIDLEHPQISVTDRAGQRQDVQAL